MRTQNGTQIHALQLRTNCNLSARIQNSQSPMGSSPVERRRSQPSILPESHPGRQQPTLERVPSLLVPATCRYRTRSLYFTSTVAPASVNFFLMVSASSLLTPSLIGLGAPSTRSLASFRPRLVTSRTALMTLILLAPTTVRTTENSVFSSATGAAAAAGPPATMTGAAAAADTPSFSSSSLTSWDASSSVKP